MAAESAAARVTGSLRRRLLTGALKPGEPLSQSRVAAEYGVSRIPVRDALQTLAAEGLVDLGAFTAVVRGLSIAELQELYELRETIEPLVAGIAVPNVGRAEIALMTSIMHEMESDPAPLDWLIFNARFHAVIYSCADRPRMIELTRQLRRLTDRYLYLHIDALGTAGRLKSEHRLILEAVRRHDTVTAAELTRQHIASSHEHLVGHLLEQLTMRRG